VDRAKAFYLRLGFREDVDFVGSDGYRILQLTPPGSPCSWLYSSILHEYQHVLQTERPSGLPTIDSAVPGQQSARVYRMQRAVEAYATEILRSQRTGVDQHPQDVRDLWERLRDAWSYLSDSLKEPVKDLDRGAHTRAEAILGIGTLRHFTPR